MRFDRSCKLLLKKYYARLLAQRKTSPWALVVVVLVKIDASFSSAPGQIAKDKNTAEFRIGE